MQNNSQQIAFSNNVLKHRKLTTQIRKIVLPHSNEIDHIYLKNIKQLGRIEFLMQVCARNYSYESKNTQMKLL